MHNRGFEIIAEYKEKNIELPSRKTARSAGYDLASAEDLLLKPNQVMLIPTGLKAYMQDEEYLGIHIRSSLAIHHQIMLINSQGIIDADYYNNPDNEGHIMIAVMKLGTNEFFIPKGTRIAQGLFYKYLKIDNDLTVDTKRIGGIGSTGR